MEYCKSHSPALAYIYLYALLPESYNYQDLCPCLAREGNYFSPGQTLPDCKGGITSLAKLYAFEYAYYLHSLGTTVMAKQCHGHDHSAQELPTGLIATPERERNHLPWGQRNGTLYARRASRNSTTRQPDRSRDRMHHRVAPRFVHSAIADLPLIGSRHIYMHHSGGFHLPQHLCHCCLFAGC